MGGIFVCEIGDMIAIKAIRLLNWINNKTKDCHY